ncbi:hypothetical protein JCM5296_002560, partial [Sporobolomyces johnsonii]
ATLESARPFRYHSAKFNSAQRNYHTTDQELLAVLDLCLKFKEVILGWDVVVATDHLPLKTYWDQPPKLTRRHNFVPTTTGSSCLKLKNPRLPPTTSLRFRPNRQPGCSSPDSPSSRRPFTRATSGHPPPSSSHPSRL